MKTLVIGLDGVPRRLLEELAENGVMPGIKELIDAGHLEDLAASIPEISSVSWSSFMTAANPGVHGIFGFTDLVPGERRIRFPRFSDLACSTFWDRLGALGKRCVVINQPSTYPAKPMKGVLVSGFVALELDRAVYPARHVPRLRRLGYIIDVDMRRGRANGNLLLDDLSAALAIREKAAEDLFREEDWDLFQFVVTGTDRLQHVLWDALEDAQHPLHQRVLDFYHQVDAVVSRLVSRFRQADPAGFLLILSDHGFTRARREVRINAWLREAGYLRCRGDDPSTLEDLDDSTQAFALDPARIYICGRDREAVGEEIGGKLRPLTFEGKPVIRAVHRSPDIYAGPQMDRAPDLVVQAHDGFDLKATLKSRDVFAPPSLCGMHNSEAFVLTDRPIGAQLEIADLGSIILSLYGS